MAEFMLQQTQVESALPYYRRFLRVFPTLRALADSRQQDVLKVWEGLGYYQRAARLHAAAKKLAGRRPRFSDLEGMPGFGPYTLAAVGSIVFGLPQPVVDGNVRRVMARVLALPEPPDTPRGRRRIQRELASWISRRSPGDFNQSMMEVGAKVCTPRNPRCHACPLSTCCQAFARARPEAYPKRRPAPDKPHHHIAAAVIRRQDGRILIAQRPAKGLLPNLWEFPGGKREHGESLKACCEREIREELSITVEVGRQLARVEHAYSHYSVTLHFFECRYKAGRPQAKGCQAFRWCSPQELSRFPFPRANWELVSRLSGRPFPP